MSRAGDHQHRRRTELFDIFLVRARELIWDAKLRCPRRGKRISNRFEWSEATRIDHLHKDVHDPAADQAIIPAIVVVETKFQQLGFVIGEKCDRLLANFRFNTPAALRAEGSAVG